MCRSKFAFAAIILLIHSSGLSAELTGLLGIPWGANAHAAREQIGARPHTKLEIADKKYLKYVKGKFAGVEFDTLELMFGEGGLHSASLVFKPKSIDYAATFDRLKMLVSAKYGAPQRDDRPFRFACHWDFREPGKPVSMITLSIQSAIRLEYESEKTTKSPPKSPNDMRPAAKRPGAIRDPQDDL